MAERRRALIVAVDHYEQLSLQRLASPAADAEALAGVLGDQDLGGFDVDVVHNPTSWVAAERVEAMLAESRPDDLVLVHFSCHGLKDDSGELYLAATNTRPDRLGSTAVDAAWVNRMMQRSRARRVVLLLDCCYGGAFERGVIARAGGKVDVGDQFRQRELGESQGRVVITASTAMEYAFEGARLTADAPVTPSVFTGALVDGIRTGDADRDQDGQVTLGELYDYVYDRVREQSPRQTPCKWEFGLRGDLFVARNPHRRVRPVALARELLDLVAHPLAAVRLTAVRELAPIAAGSHAGRAVAARLALEKLAGDDSRQVSAAATEVLGTPLPQQPATEAPATGPLRSASEPGKPGPRPVQIRRRFVPAIVAVTLMLLAALVLIWLPNLGGNDDPNDDGATARDYDLLVELMPESIRGDCKPREPNAGSTASAACGAGIFDLWNSAADMADVVRPSPSVAGDCTEPPTAYTHLSLPTVDHRAGTLACRLVNAEIKGSQFYKVVWSVDELLLTGSFDSAKEADATGYRLTYQRAIEVLNGMN